MEAFKEWLREVEREGYPKYPGSVAWSELIPLANAAFRAGMLRAAEIADGYIGCDCLAADIRKEAEE